MFKQTFKNLLRKMGVITAKQQIDSDWLTVNPRYDHYVLEKYLNPTGKFFFPEFKSSAPGSKHWYAALLSSINQTIENKPVTLLDYGCGNGALGNYLSGFMSDFQYYGLEPSASPSLENTLEHACFRFGHFGSDTESLAIKQSNCATLGSVFTHLRWGECQKILEKLSPIAEQGGGKSVLRVFWIARKNTYMPIIIHIQKLKHFTTALSLLNKLKSFAQKEA